MSLMVIRHISSLRGALYLWRLKWEGIAVPRGLGSCGKQEPAPLFSHTFRPLYIRCLPLNSQVHFCEVYFRQVPQNCDMHCPVPLLSQTTLKAHFSSGFTLGGHFVLNSLRNILMHSLNWLKTTFICSCNSKISSKPTAKHIFSRHVYFFTENVCAPFQLQVYFREKSHWKRQARIKTFFCHKPNPAKRSDVFYSNYLHVIDFPIRFQDFSEKSVRNLQGFTAVSY